MPKVLASSRWRRACPPALSSRSRAVDAHTREYRPVVTHGRYKAEFARAKARSGDNIRKDDEQQPRTIARQPVTGQGQPRARGPRWRQYRSILSARSRIGGAADRGSGRGSAGAMVAAPSRSQLDAAVPGLLARPPCRPLRPGTRAGAAGEHRRSVDRRGHFARLAGGAGPRQHAEPRRGGAVRFAADRAAGESRYGRSDPR